MRTIPDICQYLQKLDHYVEKFFTPALIDGHIPNSIERKLLSLPVKLGGMRIVTFANIAKTEYQNSRNITEALTKHRNTERLQSLIIDLPTNKIRLNEISQEKGASTQLSTLSLKEEGYSLSKQEFWDFVKMHSEWPLSRLSNMCSWLAKNNLQHSLSSKKGGFTSQ